MAKFELTPQQRQAVEETGGALLVTPQRAPAKQRSWSIACCARSPSRRTPAMWTIF